MGSMGGGGMGGGGQGGDQQHKPSQWRTFGKLFEDGAEEALGRFSGTLDEGR
jgi:hypothetical protein